MAKIKIALVDDELTARNTIKKYLEDSEIYEVVADFQNGKTALEWLRKNQADIILCDMQMPEMSGVELMRSIHIIDEYLPVVAISGFDDFNYVRGSLINGAANYILKHEMDKEGLIQALDQVKEKYRIIPDEGKAVHKNGYCITDEKEFAAEQIQRLAETGDIDFTCSNMVPVAISPDYKFWDGADQSEYRHDISRAVIDMVNQMLGGKYQYLFYITKRSHILLLISFSRERSTLFMLNTLTNLVRRLQHQIVRMLDITVTIITGEVRNELEESVSEGRKLLDLLKDKLYLGGNRTVSSVLLKKISYSERQIPENLWDQLEFELKNGMRSFIETLRDNLFETMRKERSAYDMVQKNCGRLTELLVQYAVISETEQRAAIKEMKEYEEFDQFQMKIMNLLEKHIHYFDEDKTYSFQVSQALEYIKENFAKNDISLEKCAEITGISYTYLSREFKKETGMRFVEYLNRQRVNKAKSLLIRSGISMKQVVEMSGFRNYNYFFKVFKEMEGVTPSEFAAKKQSNS